MKMKESGVTEQQKQEWLEKKLSEAARRQDSKVSRQQRDEWVEKHEQPDTIILNGVVYHQVKAFEFPILYGECIECTAEIMQGGGLLCGDCDEEEADQLQHGIKVHLN